MITGTTRVFALLGDPVGHSLSPVMQNAVFRVLGLPAVYVALPCRSDDLPQLLRAIARAGGGGNVTVPHKEAAGRAVDRRTPLAERVGAVNTFWADGDAVLGDNTDVPGLLAALGSLQPPPGPWLVAGTGGGARAAVVAASELGRAVAIVSRERARAVALQCWAQDRGVASAAPTDCRVVINATPLGLRPGDPLPISPEAAPDSEVAFDMVYAPGETPWVRAMRAVGLRACDGRAMLVAQGAAALERWFPGVSAPIEVMRAAVDVPLR